MKFDIKYWLSFSFVLLPFLSACGIVKAPDVDFNPPVAKSEKDVGVSELCSQADQSICGEVIYSLVVTPGKDKWVYWKAGLPSVVTEADREWYVSTKWDMRLTTRFPVVGSNGGETARDEIGSEGKAAFAALEVDSKKIPITVADISNLEFPEDKCESLDYKSTTLAPDFQNALLNNIGAGILKNYDLNTHNVVLSYRIFILRSADSQSYYALRFHFYDRYKEKAGFLWRKLIR